MCSVFVAKDYLVKNQNFCYKYVVANFWERDCHDSDSVFVDICRRPRYLGIVDCSRMARSALRSSDICRRSRTLAVARYASPVVGGQSLQPMG